MFSAVGLTSVVASRRPPSQCSGKGSAFSGRIAVAVNHRLHLARSPCGAGENLPKIFISHASENDDWALALSKWLAREGWDDILLDLSLSSAQETSGADIWTRAFNCDAVFFLVSEPWLSSQSPWTYRVAYQLDKKLFVLRIENVSLARLPVSLHRRTDGTSPEYQLIDLKGDPNECFNVVHPLTQKQSSVYISTGGLGRLKVALQRAGLGGAEMNQRKSVFVSFSSYDQAEALEIVSRLEAEKLKCWISCRDIPRGEDFQDAIVTALEKSGAMVLLFSKNADNSREIKKELALASESGLFVLPVRIENAEPTKGFKYQFATRQYIDLFEDRERSMTLIIDSLRKQLLSQSS